LHPRANGRVSTHEHMAEHWRAPTSEWESEHPRAHGRVSTHETMAEHQRAPTSERPKLHATLLVAPGSTHALAGNIQPSGLPCIHALLFSGSQTASHAPLAMDCMDRMPYNPPWAAWTAQTAYPAMDGMTTPPPCYLSGMQLWIPPSRQKVSRNALTKVNDFAADAPALCAWAGQHDIARLQVHVQHVVAVQVQHRARDVDRAVQDGRVVKASVAHEYLLV